MDMEQNRRAVGTEVTLSPDIGSPRRARRFVSEHLPPDLPRLDVVLLLVSELAMNAVAHVRAPFEVRVEQAGSYVRVSVSDPSPAAPVPAPVNPDSIGGRGLLLVEAMSDRWGVERRAGGKTVWFEVG